MRKISSPIQTYRLIIFVLLENNTKADDSSFNGQMSNAISVHRCKLFGVGSKF